MKRWMVDVLFALALLAGARLGAGFDGQSGNAISAAGPQVGVVVPPFSGTDQFGRTQTLETTRGAKGTMIVFFRSADW